jgi:hypothetical protein
VNRRLLAAAIAALLIIAALGWTSTAQAADPGEGAGGPVLVITDPGDQFGRYYAEILSVEGLNGFERRDIANVSAATLNGYSVVVLAQMALTDAQVSMLSGWVQGGGNLIAMRPDASLAPLLGLGAGGSPVQDGYIKVAGSGPGAGITTDTMQFHGAADRWTLAGAGTVADLYSNATTPTGMPAVTLRSVGSAGGQAAAFTYDLARSVVYTRQGNPAWAGDERDQFSPMRSNDLFFGADPLDVKPDWVNADKVAIPQADEQQRLLANLITQMSSDRVPMPRFWYFPRGEQAVVVMTGDDHSNEGTVAHLNAFKAMSPGGCSPADWQCVRATSYVYGLSDMTNAQVAAFQNEGFEIALHLNTGCSEDDRPELEADWQSEGDEFRTKWPSAQTLRTSRTHCIVWSDWATAANVEREFGIRLDTNYYYWPGTWLGNRPGMFTGSGMPMRFANENGSLIDVYQATTQLVDEWGSSPPTPADVQNMRRHAEALLDGAIGPQGYYGAFMANMHTDGPDPHPGAEAIVQAALDRGVPVVSARQLLDWTDGRNNSSFTGMSFANGALSFTLNPASGSRGLEAMIPVDGPGGQIQGLTRNGVPVATTTRVVKGIAYRVFDAAGGNYVATYPTPAGPATPPAGGGTTPPSGGSTKPPTTKPSDKTAPRVVVSLQRVRASRRGYVSLRVSCPKGESKCVVDVRLMRGRGTLGRKALSLAGGKRKQVLVKLTRTARARLADAGALRFVAQAAARDAAGNRATTTRRLRILAP